MGAFLILKLQFLSFRKVYISTLIFEHSALKLKFTQIWESSEYKVLIHNLEKSDNSFVQN